MRITATQFLSYVTANYANKVAIAREIKYQDVYDPRKDYWKKLRESIPEFEQGNISYPDFLEIPNTISNSAKRTGYRPVVDEYAGWRQSIQGQWFQPPSVTWQHETLEVKVSAEVGLNIREKRHLLKLHFKRDVISESAKMVLLTLMHDAVANDIDFVCFLDIRRKNLEIAQKPSEDARILLKIEAASFITAWNMI